MWGVVKELYLEGAPLSHVEIAKRVHTSPWRVCMTLNYLKKIGLIECLKPSKLGRNNSQPGIWTLTESGHKSMAAMPNIPS